MVDPSVIMAGMGKEFRKRWSSGQTGEVKEKWKTGLIPAWKRNSEILNS